jgi:hypothetical protein
MYYISSQIYMEYLTGCGDVLFSYSGSAIDVISIGDKWQACGDSGTVRWATAHTVVRVSDTTTLTPMYSWTNPGTSGNIVFGGAKYIKIAN